MPDVSLAWPLAANPDCPNGLTQDTKDKLLTTSLTKLARSRTNTSFIQLGASFEFFWTQFIKFGQNTRWFLPGVLSPLRNGHCQHLRCQTSVALRSTKRRPKNGSSRSKSPFAGSRGGPHSRCTAVSRTTKTAPGEEGLRQGARSIWAMHSRFGKHDVVKISNSTWNTLFYFCS